MQARTLTDLRRRCEQLEEANSQLKSQESTQLLEIASLRSVADERNAKVTRR